MKKISSLVKVLTMDGWYLHRSGAKHDLYRHASKEGQITVPRHANKDVAKGTYLSIMKAAGLK